jgi:hypothetical protein
MFGDMLAVEAAKLEMERLESEIARRHRAGLVRDEEEKQLLASLALAGSNILLSLGNTLVSAGKRLRERRTSGRAAAV